MDPGAVAPAPIETSKTIELEASAAQPVQCIEQRVVDHSDSVRP